MSDGKVCIYHISELFLYEYYCQPGDYYEVDPEDKVTPLLQKAAEEEKRGGLMGALQCYEKAHELNPVSTTIYYRIIDGYYRLGNHAMVKRYTDEVYPYCATRAELAAYYRWLGWYYLEEYQPELSEALYRYSTLFDQSAQAENEIHYLETALGRKMPDYSAKELQEQLLNAEIPVAANSVTLALIYRAGEEALQRANIRQALDCYEMVYDLTADREVGEKIAEMVTHSREDERP